MNEFRKEKNLNYGVFSPKFETYRRLKLGKSKIQNFKYCKAILGSPSNFNSSIKYHKNRSTYFSPDYTNNLLSPIHKNRKRLKKCCSQKNITERPTSFTSRSFPTVINNFRGAKSPVYKTTGNNNILYDTSNENTSNFFNLETEKLYQETRQIRKVVKFLTKELLKLKKENEEKDRQITIKEKEINNIIIKNNSLTGAVIIDTNDINKVNEFSTNSSYISNSNKTKLKKSSSQKNITERPSSVSSHSFPTVMNNFRIIKSPIYKTTTGNSNILYNTSIENKSKYFNLETEKLYQETRQIKKLVKILTKELLTLRRENEEKDKQITIKEKQINDIIIKNNSLLLGTANIDNNDIIDINKINENSTNTSYISNDTTNKSNTNRTNKSNTNKTDNNSNIFNDSIYINALSSNRNSSTGNLFFRIKKEIKQTNNEMKLENDKYEKLKKSVYVTKMNELSIESNLLQKNKKKINSLLENALIIKRNNDIKNEELMKIKDNLENQKNIENNLNTMVIKLEKKENELKDRLEINEFKLINKIKEVNININKLVILKKKNENLNNDKVIRGEIYTTINKNNGNPVQINSIYKNKIRELKKSIKFYERQIKYSEDE